MELVWLGVVQATRNAMLISLSSCAFLNLSTPSLSLISTETASVAVGLIIFAISFVTCLTFSLKGYGNGSYSLIVDGSLVKSGGQFASSDDYTFGLCSGEPPVTQNPTSQVITLYLLKSLRVCLSD